MACELVIVDKENHIAVLALNRPEKRNALSIALRDAIAACLDELEEDDTVSVVILRGNGPAFCAGFDLTEFGNREPEHVQRLLECSDRYHRKVATFAKPLIAAVHGPALAGGFDLANLCDVRIAADNASFGHVEVRYGIGVMYRLLKEIIGGGLARDMCLSGRVIDAQEAYRIGLVSKVIPSDQLLAEAKAYAEGMAETPADGLKRMKALVTSLSDGVREVEAMSGIDFFAEAELPSHWATKS